MVSWFFGFFFFFHLKGEMMPGQVRRGSLLSSSPGGLGGNRPYLTERGLLQTLCLAQLGCQESGTQEEHKHKSFLSPDNLFAQKKVSDSSLNPKRKARERPQKCKSELSWASTGTLFLFPLFLKKVLFPNFSR